MQDNIGQVALLTFNTSRWNVSQLYQSILLCINFELFHFQQKSDNKKKVVFFDYLTDD